MKEQVEAGEISSGGQREPGASGFSKNPNSLEEQGIDKNLANAARKAAAFPEEEFEEEVAKAGRLARAGRGNRAERGLERRKAACRRLVGNQPGRGSTWGSNAVRALQREIKIF